MTSEPEGTIPRTLLDEGRQTDRETDHRRQLPLLQPQLQQPPLPHLQVNPLAGQWLLRKGGLRHDVRMSAPDPSLDALADLLVAVEETERDLTAIKVRAAHIQQQRAAGVGYTALVSAEEPPMIVSLLARVNDRLNQAGGEWRRREAQALHDEGLSMEAIAGLFGVSRQRVSALLRR
ncbi:hypothetical protein ACXR2U_05315 [Jatrophihabitans sp. YIM 134969]